eukprot:10175682-Ditylum_brightwellii.AAC.1
MSWGHCNFIWKNFHVQSDIEHYQSDKYESDDNVEEDDDNKLCEQTMEKVQRHEEDMHGNDVSVDISDSDEDETRGDNHPVGDISEHPWKKDVWYYKLEAFLNHIRKMFLVSSMFLVLACC